jgi:REP element-mobilizing transposase RayT
MARALRIEVAGGRYHVMSRGNERREIFADDRDRLHFLQETECRQDPSGSAVVKKRSGRTSYRVGELAGGVDYAAVGAGISRFQRRLSRDANLARIMQQCRIQLSNVEI